MFYPSPFEGLPYNRLGFGGGSWDLVTSYELINNVIINTLKKSEEGRIDRLLVAINQSDMAMKGWN